jgi:uncharacterized protein (DUF2236 family)
VPGAAVDVGLFGPDSVTWRVQAEPILWVGGIRALFLQALHPLAMAGVAQHSSFRDDPWGRLRRTAEFVGVVTYGTTAEARAAGDMVKRAHRGLQGVEPDSGQRYVVSDAKLLLWVHCCQVECFLATVQRAGLGLTDDEADQYVAEQVAAAELVGIPRRLVPSDVAQLTAYFDDIRPTLRATEAARDSARFLLAPPMPTKVALLTPARPVWTLLAGFAFASLPRWARTMYGRGGVVPTDLAVSLSSRVLARLLNQLPATWRTGPHHRAAMERLASAS